MIDDEITERERFAQTVLERTGPTESLLMAMRLVLLVGQRKPDDPQVIGAAKQAIDAIKRLGEHTGVM